MTHSRRYTELIHRAEDGRRDPLEVGCWVVASDRDHEHPLGLALVTEGPTYMHQDGHAIDSVWRIHDRSWRSVADLTRLDLAGVLEEAATLLAAIRRGANPEQRGATMLRIHRTACLARRAMPQLAGDAADAASQLGSIIAVDEALAELELAWRQMIRVRLPNLVHALAAAAACELARHPIWRPGLGIPHPCWQLVETGSSASPSARR